MAENLQEALDRAVRPNFFLVGAMKAGTTAVFDSLGAHPDVYCSPIKEPNFFCDDLRVEKLTSTDARDGRQFDVDSYVKGSMDNPVHEAFVDDPATYYALFRFAESDMAIGECSTSYLYSRVAARNIRASVPHARIIMILRNPVDRAISQYYMECRLGIVYNTFGSLLEEDLTMPHKTWGYSRLYVELGRYVAQVQRYLTVFSRQQVKIILYDDLRLDFDNVIADVLRFLDVDPALRSTKIVTTNSARVPRAAGLNYLLSRYGVKRVINRICPQPLIERGKRIYYRKPNGTGVTEADRERLRTVLADEVMALSELLGRDLSHWLKAPPEARSKPMANPLSVPVPTVRSLRSLF